MSVTSRAKHSVSQTASCPGACTSPRHRVGRSDGWPGLPVQDTLPEPTARRVGPVEQDRRRPKRPVESNENRNRRDWWCCVRRDRRQGPRAAYRWRGRPGSDRRQCVRRICRRGSWRHRRPEGRRGRGRHNRRGCRLPIRVSPEATTEAPFCAVEVPRRGVGSLDSSQALDSQDGWAQSAVALVLRTLSGSGRR